MTRLKQVTKYGWKHSGEYAKSLRSGVLRRISIFFDILTAYFKYRMWSNQYLKERFYELDAESRISIGKKYLEEGLKRDAWQNDFRENRKFLIKYSNVKYERASLREKRNKAYAKRFNAGSGLFVEYDVNISRQHYLDGEISIGKNVLFAKHVFIDYSGEVIIEDEVKFSQGAILESHTHPHFSNPSIPGKVAVQSKVHLERGVNVGAGSIILDSCSKIGRYARIASGAVIRNKIPPYAIVVGNPGKIVGFVMSPDEVSEFEKDKFNASELTNIEEYKKVYEKYFLNRFKENKKFLAN